MGLSQLQTLCHVARIWDRTRSLGYVVLILPLHCLSYSAKATHICKIGWHEAGQVRSEISHDRRSKQDSVWR